MSKLSNPPVFCFQSHQVRTIIEGEQIWFAAVDVCRALGISWSGRKILRGFPDDWQRVVKLTTLRRGEQESVVISEPALYKLAFRSNKPQADAFTNWVASEVLPSIRQTGKYEAKPKPKALPKSSQKALPAPACYPAEEGRQYWDHALEVHKAICKTSINTMYICKSYMEDAQQQMEASRKLLEAIERLQGRS